MSDEPCDCDECCPRDFRGCQGKVGFAALDAIGPQGTIGPEYTAPQGERGYQGQICSCDPDTYRGPQGITGAQGDAIRGPQGSEGPQGDATHGPQGMDGPQGPIGSQGASERGPQGFDGLLAVGMKGAQGLVGFLGVVGTQGSQGTWYQYSNFDSRRSYLQTLGELVTTITLPSPGLFLITLCVACLTTDPVIATFNLTYNTFPITIIATRSVSIPVFPTESRVYVTMDVIVNYDPFYPIVSFEFKVSNITDVVLYDRQYNIVQLR